MIRKTPLKRTPMRRKPARRGPIPMDVRLIVWERSGGRCEGNLPGICTGTAEEWHHRRTRAVGDAPHVPSNGLALCRACHHHITHVSPAEGRRRGIVVSRHHPNPGDVPVLRFGRSWALLDDNGGWKEAPHGDH